MGPCTQKQALAQIEPEKKKNISAEIQGEVNKKDSLCQRIIKLLKETRNPSKKQQQVVYWFDQFKKKNNLDENQQNLLQQLKSNVLSDKILQENYQNLKFFFKNIIKQITYSLNVKYSSKFIYDAKELLKKQDKDIQNLIQQFAKAFQQNEQQKMFVRQIKRKVFQINKKLQNKFEYESCQLSQKSFAFDKNSEIQQRLDEYKQIFKDIQKGLITNLQQQKIVQQQQSKTTQFKANQQCSKQKQKIKIVQLEQTIMKKQKEYQFEHDQIKIYIQKFIGSHQKSHDEQRNTSKTIIQLFKLFQNQHNRLIQQKNKQIEKIKTEKKQFEDSNIKKNKQNQTQILLAQDKKQLNFNMSQQEKQTLQKIIKTVCLIQKQSQHLLLKTKIHKQYQINKNLNQTDIIIQNNSLQNSLNLLQQKIQKINICLTEIGDKLKENVLIPQNQRVKAFFQGQVLTHCQKQKKFLLNALTTFMNRDIYSTKLLFSLNQVNKCNFHSVIDNIPCVIVIIKTHYTIIGAFYKGKITEDILLDDALIFQISDEKIYPLINAENNPKRFNQVKQVKAMQYDPILLIYGNSDLRLKAFQSKVYCNIATKNSLFFTNNDKINDFLKQKQQKEVQMVEMEFYQVQFS